ncbi:hypothetical protein EIP91_001641 [Steccherinum ochraceum]|uniref:Protein-S-isoprenylcysteine O-methyltransferase n=1 Tax=Steccherinum ochraceum TaxID=92696 RepID=A0A4R0RQX7_9APHY|nr:hypothetical protein EIP91_001641 [Steccherinum ochraceum]
MLALLRALLLCAQVPCYQWASTPPNKTPAKGRYDATMPWHLRIASSVIQAQQPIVWICTLADLIIILAQQSLFPLPQSASTTIQSAICPFPAGSTTSSTSTSAPLNATAASSAASPLSILLHTVPSSGPYIHATALSILGLFFIALGTFIRVTCYRTLGALFTFDLTIQEKHKLITWGPYAFVRHPAYTGSLCVMLGLALVNLTRGGWVAECGVLGVGWAGAAVRTGLFVAWYVWWLSVGVYRAELEDGVLKKLFGNEWDVYAKKVTCWFVPGIF